MTYSIWPLPQNIFLVFSLVSEGGPILFRLIWHSDIIVDVSMTMI
jgi:hypothetical protein